MPRRILLWGCAGLAVGLAWVFLIVMAGHEANLGRLLIVAITAPASILGHRRPMSVYEFLLLNALIYAGVGFLVELARAGFRRPVKAVTS